MTAASDTSWKTRLLPTDSVGVCIRVAGADVSCLPQRETKMESEYILLEQERATRFCFVSFSQIMVVFSGNKSIYNLQFFVYLVGSSVLSFIPVRHLMKLSHSDSFY
jgi:hypothetical protein